MEYIIRFLVSVMASVTGYYIRKWLDRNDKDSITQKRNPRELPLWGFALARNINPIS